MDFKINEIEYAKVFDKKVFNHTRGRLLKLFPLSSERPDLVDSIPDMESFAGITGEFFRACHDMQYAHTPTNKELLDSVILTVTTDEPTQLKAIITSLLFDANDDVYLFSAQILPHLKLRSNNSKLQVLQEFVANLLIDDEVKALIKCSKGDSHENILYNLIIEHLNKLSSETVREWDKEGYYHGQLASDIRALFKTDLANLSKLQEFYIANVSQLIKYYYFHYITQQSLRSADLFDQKREIHPLYFTLNWEKLSRSRLALEHGWKKVESNATALFAHANTLELLNMISFNKKFVCAQGPFTYWEIREDVQKMTQDEENDFTASIYKLIRAYRQKIVDVSWESFDEIYEPPQSDIYQQFHSLSLIHQLFSAIKYQFENSARSTSYREFGNWYKTFVKSSYFKLRGSLGGSLKIDRDLLLMMTELSIMSQGDGQDKILVSKLWDQLELRGIYLDEKTKQAVITFFGK
ncbi:MAG TPA: DNA phosphorothioation-dependent restriction protein DptG, partial [Mucilaginibacter sp.]